jgi:hypothetical protein
MAIVKNAESQLLELSRALTPGQRRELLTYGQRLRAKPGKSSRRLPVKDGDAAWERILNDPSPRPKLRAYVERILREEKAEPLDLGKL